MSWEVNAAGVIKRMQTQTPKSQTRLISSADFRLMIRVMSGILKRGRTAPAQALILKRMSTELNPPAQGFSRIVPEDETHFP